MEENADKYNGWTNYETWTVSLWLDNEESSYRYWRDQAQQHRETASESPQVIEGIWTIEQAANFNLADQLEEEITAGIPLQEPSIYNDLLTAALSEVNWTEIAENWLSEEQA